MPRSLPARKDLHRSTIPFFTFIGRTKTPPYESAGFFVFQSYFPPSFSNAFNTSIGTANTTVFDASLEISLIEFSVRK